MTEEAGMSRMFYRIAALLTGCLVLAAPGLRAHASDEYPTAARSEFVFACMATNGGTQDALGRCSCAIDVIASVLPYDRYEEAETVLRMRHNVGGYLADVFRSAPSNDMVRELDEAQAEAEIRCF